MHTLITKEMSTYKYATKVHTLRMLSMILWCFMCVVEDHLHFQSFLQDFVIMHNARSKSLCHTLDMWEIVSSKRFFVSTPCSQLQLVRCSLSLICCEAGKDCWRASNAGRYQEKTPRWARRSSGGRGQQERVTVSLWRRFVRIGRKCNRKPRLLCEEVQNCELYERR